MYNDIQEIRRKVFKVGPLLNLNEKIIPQLAINRIRAYLELVVKNDLNSIGGKRKEFSKGILRIFISDGYIRSYIVYHLLLLYWMREKSIESKGDKELFEMGICGLVGYRIKDIFMDTKKVQHLKDYYLISESLINLFYHKIMGYSSVNNYELIYRHKQFLQYVEINEKFSMRKKLLCYKLPIEAGYKSTMLFIFLYIINNKDEEKFKSMLYSFTAVVQILDDMEDLKEDVQNGHYSIFFNQIYNQELIKLPEKEQVNLALSKKNLLVTKSQCLKLLSNGKFLAHSLGENLFAKLYDKLFEVVEEKFSKYCH